MKLISVNIGKAQAFKAKPAGRTGIFKLPAQGSVQINTLGLAGDAICDTKNHGGPDQAVYIYGALDYDWWSKELGRALAPGTFGDNLTISDLESAGFSVGDRLHVGSVILEVSAPRGPCVTLATRMEDPEFVKRFRRAGRPGLYCRVIQEGQVRSGDEVTLEPYSGETVTIAEMFHDAYEREHSEAFLRRMLSAPIAIRAREDTEEELKKL
jgi:MOSC domain-containing protein YiiM